ncbi:MAG: hypothetical protein RRX93_01575 [Bacteroidales bacterium]
MKLIKLYIIGVLAFLALFSIVTNPKQERFQKEIHKNLQQLIEDSSTKGIHNEFVLFSSSYIDSIINGTADAKLTYQNKFIFSLISLEYPKQTYKIGIGFWGHFYFFKDTKTLLHQKFRQKK